MALLLASAGLLGAARQARPRWLLVGPHPIAAAFRDGMAGLGVELGTARALGIAIPPAVLLRADGLVE